MTLLDRIREIGLFNDPRPWIYGDQYNSWRVPSGGLWQLPDQLVSALEFLSNKDIKTYLEIGCFHGHTCSLITNFLNTKSIGVDVKKWFSGEVSWEFHLGTSEDFKGQHFDLVLIDGNHDYEAVKEDYNNIGKFSRFCMFHDVDDSEVATRCLGGGVPQFWKELKGNKIQFVDNRKVMGIGIIQT